MNAAESDVLILVCESESTVGNKVGKVLQIVVQWKNCRHCYRELSEHACKCMQTQ